MSGYRKNYNNRPLTDYYTRPQIQQAYQRYGVQDGLKMLNNPTIKSKMQQRNYSNSAAIKKEIKCVDMNITQNPVLTSTNTNGGIAPVNCIQPGTGSWNRIGKRIKMKSVRYKGTIQFINTGTNITTNSSVRMCLVYDKQPSSGSIPIFNEIFGSTTQTGTESTNGIFDNLRVDNTDRFSILKDDVYTSNMQPVPSGGTSSEYQCYFDTFVKLKELDTVFSGQSNPCTIADISSGALYLVYRSEDLSPDMAVAVESATLRLRYYD